MKTYPKISPDPNQSPSRSLQRYTSAPVPPLDAPSVPDENRSCDRKTSGPNTYGTIQVGRAADLVLLDMNPLEDISHTRKIHAVVLGGQFYPLASIKAQSLQDAAKR
jgi:hypothetical protein